MIDVKFVMPGTGGHEIRLVPAIPREGDTVRLHDGPLGAGPALYWVMDIVWDVPVTPGNMMIGPESSVEVWLTNERPKGKR